VRLPYLEPATGRSRAIVFALIAALWFAGTLGLMHRTVHGPGLSKAVAVLMAVGDTEQRSEGGNALGTLFGEHSDAECRLYDQLSHGAGVLNVPLIVLPMLLPAATFAYLQGEALVRWATLFDARGPPSAR
jgi:hypothetical protein